MVRVCLDKFNVEFSKFMQDGPDEVVSTDSEKVKYDKLDTDVSEETIKDVYRKVAAKTHPDKKDGNEAKGKKTLAKQTTDEKYYALIIGNNDYDNLHGQVNNIYRHLKNKRENIRQRLMW